MAAVSRPADKAVLTGMELASAAALVTAVYGGALYGLHAWAGRETGHETLPGSGESNYWGTLPSAWDHPEPNYLVSPVIGEFWSVLTTIPVAGTLLLYTGLKYGYGTKVLRIYALTCAMYTLAFSAHLTLQKHVFSTTVTAVMSNALLTFAEFSSVAHRMLRSAWVRGTVVLLAETLLVFTVATLPYALSANGGVWTLFVVQAPGVFLATIIAGTLAARAKTVEERSTFATVSVAGALLSSAMAMSLVECLIGFEHGFLRNWWGFPWLHIAIHVFEQVGIYIFGVGVAALHELLFLPQPRAGAQLRYVGYCVPYLYCPQPRGESAPVAAKEGQEPSGSEACGSEASESEGTIELQAQARGRSAERTESKKLDEPDVKAQSTLKRRHRAATPGGVVREVAATPARG